MNKTHSKKSVARTTSAVECMNTGETYSYQGWLNSDSFLKRSLAVVGYSFVGTLIIYAIIFCLAIVVGGIGGLISLIL